MVIGGGTTDALNDWSFLVKNVKQNFFGIFLGESVNKYEWILGMKISFGETRPNRA